MSKKRKTRKEKELADLRSTHIKPIQTVLSQDKPTFSYTTVATPAATPSPVSYKEPIPNHAYVIHDVWHTLVITVALILINAAVYIAIQNNVIPLHFLGL